MDQLTQSYSNANIDPTHPDPFLSDLLPDDQITRIFDDFNNDFFACYDPNAEENIIRLDTITTNTEDSNNIPQLQQDIDTYLQTFPCLRNLQQPINLLSYKINICIANFPYSWNLEKWNEFLSKFINPKDPIAVITPLPKGCDLIFNDLDSASIFYFSISIFLLEKKDFEKVQIFSFLTNQNHLANNEQVGNEK